VDTSTLRWTLCFREAVFSTSDILFSLRGSFNLPEGCIGLTGYVRLTNRVAGDCAVSLRWGIQNNTEVAGGINFRSLLAVNHSDFGSQRIDAAAPIGASLVRRRGSFPIIYLPHVTVFITAFTSGGPPTVNLTYEVWCAALVIH